MNQGFRTPPEIHDALVAKGFKLYRNRDRINDYCKSVPATRCHCNYDKEGIQVVVHAVVFNGNEPHLNWDVAISGEVKDGTWRRHAVSGTDDPRDASRNTFLARLDDRIATLVDEWNRSAK